MEYGLITRQGRKTESVPLEKVEISSKVCGLFMEVTIVQTYKNRRRKEMEAVYTFPVPDTAAVTSFEAIIGERKVKGQIREREQALKEYNDAVLGGDSAFLLEEFRPNVFQVSVGQVLPGEQAEIHISYIDEIQCQDGEVRLMIPTVVAPRYITGKPKGGRKGMGMADPTDRVPDADFITPPVEDVDYSVRFELDILPMAPVEADSFASPSHKITVSHRSDGRSIVTLAQGTAAMDRDFVLTYRYAQEQAAGAVFYQKDEDGGFAHLLFIPELEPEEEAPGKDYLFLMDISGSMSGRKLEQAKSALQLCLRNLSFKDSFNIVAFESSYYLFAENSLPFNQDSLDKATRWIKELDSMGGTEILSPIQYVLKQGKDSTILLFTDGEVGNEREIISYVKKHRGDNRIYTFGIDTAVNSFFINALAEAGCGRSEFVYPGERIDDKVLRQFSRIASPIADYITIDWGSIKAKDLTPAQIRHIYDMEPVSIFLQYQGAFTGNVTLRGNVGKKPFSCVIGPDAVHAAPDSLIEKVWARRKIAQLEESLHECKNPRLKDSIQQQIIHISATYGIISSLTSYVAVYERENKALGVPETVVVPVALPESWESSHPADRLMRFSARRNDIAEVHSYVSMASPAPGRKKKSMAGKIMDSIFFSQYKNGYYYIDNSDRELVDWRKDIGPLTVENVLRVLGRNQKANGAFSDDSVDKEESFRTTALGMVLFLYGGENVNAYRRIIEKAAAYLWEGIKDRPLDEDDLLHDPYEILSLTVLELSLQRGLLRKQRQEIEAFLSNVRARCQTVKAMLDRAQSDRKGTLQGLLLTNLEKKELLKSAWGKCKNEQESIPVLVKMAVNDMLEDTY